jgi:glucosamine-6-phosphate deaminase
VAAIRVDVLEPADAAAEHDAAARDLDLVLLGLGMNGHVGFNEPGSTAGSPTRVVELDEATLAAAVERYAATRRPTAGITLGLDRILEAREVWVLATGARKADVLAHALEGPETPDVPASYLRRHPNLVVFVDRAARRAPRLDRRPDRPEVPDGQDGASDDPAQ